MLHSAHRNALSLQHKIQSNDTMKFVDVKNDVAFHKIFGDSNKYNWSLEELKAYDDAAVREADWEQKRLKSEEIGKEIGKDKKEREAVCGMHENGIPIPIIAKSLKIIEAKVIEIIAIHQQ